MTSIPGDVILSIAEWSDPETILSLMLVCRYFHLLISENETPIVKAKLCHLQQLTFHPSMLKADDGVHFLPAHLQPAHLQLVAPHGCVIKSGTPDRGALLPLSFSVLKELNMREARLDVLLVADGHMETALQESGLFFPDRRPTDDEMNVLMARLRRACRITDRLADCTAAVMVEYGFPGPMFPGAEDGDDDENTGGTGSDDGLDDSPDDQDSGALPAPVPLSTRTYERPLPSTLIHPNRRHNRFGIARAVRFAQGDLLRALPLEDLVFLAILTSIAGLGYRRLHHATAYTDPEFFERATAFQETVLRQGATVTFWGKFAGVRVPTQAELEALSLAAIASMSPATTTAGPNQAALLPPTTDDAPGGQTPQMTAMRAYVDQKTNDALRELRWWEHGAGANNNMGANNNEDEDDEDEAPAGLQMTVWRTIRKRSGWSSDNAGRRAHDLARRIVRGLPATVNVDADAGGDDDAAAQDEAQVEAPAEARAA
ncbi:hypothetical protein QBC33DRAFT_192556 [Phialemonium atrogriseum]|uniref:F-box domain-containing protein n=1 Tax=Phialemonium atrogriseum TaxID=1093897 RepID=A0AAJ0FDJ8_9PEZI|nr:uncharacterized protein QBC33DRAFT_192556 [Phialemonium atrogriseum]KAK1764666.1 hypothetical protein QBC33DRAFT_192556 [Phialemonium atrogriseum]